MQIVITVSGADGARADVNDLRRWLTHHPPLRGRVKRAADPTPQPGTMGLAADALLALLAPGGVATVLAGAVIAWVQARKGNHTITFTRPDGTEVSVTSSQVGPLDPAQAETLARHLAAGLEAAAPTALTSPPDPEGPGRSDGQPAP